MGWPMLLAAGASAVIQAAGAKASANSQSSALQYQAAVARNNQTIADRNAETELLRGQQMEGAKREQTAQTIGTNIARRSAGGIRIDTGSPQRVISDTGELGELDALTIRNNAVRSAQGFRQQGLDFSSQAAMNLASSRDVVRAGNIGAFGSIVGGAASVSDKWLRFKQAGVSGPWGD